MFTTRYSLLSGPALACAMLAAMPQPASAHGAVLSASAELVPISGSNVHGTLSFHQVDDRTVHVSGTVEGLKPGRHGFHVHVNGNCDSPDGMSAGGHFAPTGGRHGSPSDKDHHLGDLGNILADETGRASVDLMAEGMTLTLIGVQSIVDRSVIIHANEDDYSDPAGNSGSRVACGVIESGMMRM